MNASFPAVLSDVVFTHWHLFCGLGAGARGFNKGSAKVGSLRAKFRCIGGVDNDPAAVRDFGRLAGTPGTLIDMFDLEQYRAFHGRDPEPGWRQAMPEDIRRSAGFEFPDMVFLSAPCKGFSGLLPEQSSTTAKYQALNRLTLRGVWLMLEAFKDDLPKLVIFENVPRIMTRGRALLNQIVALLRSYGYAVAETTHDCGEIGGLGQSRKRFLLVARHEAKVPPFLYEPEKRRLRGVGEILEKLPMPGDARGGPLHRMPALQWKTWVRLAFVEAGSDWRSLNKLAIADGVLRDFGILPDEQWQSGVLGVRRWEDTTGVVAGRSSPTNGAFSVADPRAPVGSLEYQQYGVREWDQPSGAVINVKSPGQGTFSVSDPRIDGKPRFNNVYRIVPWASPAPAVAGPGGPAGGLAVADPRPSQREDYKQTKYRVTGYEESAGTVIAASSTGNGAFAVADPRPGYGDGAHQNILAVTDWDERSKTVTGARHAAGGALSVADPRPVGLNENREHYKTGGHYGVLPWEQHAGAVPAYGKYDRGPWSVADPRGGEGDETAALPAASDRLVAVIRALDGTWHRPFTTLELAALQSLFDPDDIAEGFTLDGQSDSAWRERIGNAVPPDAAAAIAGVMGTTLLLAMTGETFMLSSQPIWVQPIALALAVDQRGNLPAEDIQ
jgi:site-specific DNA-cytosine methylase